MSSQRPKIVSADNFREIENEYNIQIYHVFGDLRRMKLEVALLQKENKKLLDLLTKIFPEDWVPREPTISENFLP